MRAIASPTPSLSLVLNYLRFGGRLGGLERALLVLALIFDEKFAAEPAQEL